MGGAIPGESLEPMAEAFRMLDDPLVDRLCRLVCETIAQEVAEDLRREERLFHGGQTGA